MSRTSPARTGTAWWKNGRVRLRGIRVVEAEAKRKAKAKRRAAAKIAAASRRTNRA